MSEVYPTDAELNTLSGTTDSEQEVLFVTTGESPYYTSFYKMLSRLLAVARRAGDLRVYKDGDLTFGVRAGKFFNGDAVVNYAGAAAQALTNNATNYIYVTAAGALTVNTTGFPVPSVTPHIPLATIVTAAGDYDCRDVSDGGAVTDYRGRSIFQVCGAEAAAEMTVYNDTGIQINAGQLLNVSSWNAANSCFQVQLADADTVDKPTQLVASANIANGAVGVATTRYDLTGVDTSGAAAVGDPVYLSATAGGWTLTAPTGADQVEQEVGRVTVKNAAGAIRFDVGLAATREKVGTTGIQDSAVTTAKIAADAVDKVKINSDVAGSGLEQHTDGTLRIAAAAAGNGLEGGAGSALAVKLDGATLAVSASGAKVADNGVAVGQLAAAVQDLIPNLTITAGAEVADKRTITVQARDAANNNLAQRFMMTVWISTVEYGMPDSTNTTAIVETGAIYAPHETDVGFDVISDANGRVAIGFTIIGAATRYIMAEVDGRIYSSGALNWAA
jgi:hypothetical protein